MVALAGNFSSDKGGGRSLVWGRAEPLFIGGDKPFLRTGKVGLEQQRYRPRADTLLRLRSSIVLKNSSDQSDQHQGILFRLRRSRAIRPRRP
jgi:hypothetical protein